MISPIPGANTSIAATSGRRLHRELELLVRPLEHFDRLAVIHMCEFRAGNAFEFRNEPLFDALVEKREGFLPSVQCPEDLFQTASSIAHLLSRAASSDML